MQGLPTYDDCVEKPAQFDHDRGNDPRFVVLAHLTDSLVCLEQLVPGTQNPR